jgi:uncharacterized protein YebE (UPF0316 family)
MNILSLVETMDRCNSLTENNAIYMAEGIMKSVKKYMGKIGLDIEKDSKGVIDYILSFGKGVGRMFVALLSGDIDTAKLLLQDIKKEDVIDFILKLDMVTVHLLSGPLHILHGLTGWEILPKIEKKIENATKGVMQMLFDAIKKARLAITKVFSPNKQAKLMGHLKKIENQAIAIAKAK